MAISSIKNVDLGSTITFKSKDPNDTVNWKGTLDLIGTSNILRGYGDPRARNEAVRQVDPTVPSDITLLTFFVITVDNDAETPTSVLFADQWITPGSLVELTPGNRVTIVVDDPKNNSQAILSILASAGYTTRIIPTS